MEEQPKAKNTLVIVLAVVGAALLLVVAIVGVLAAVGIAGVRSYLSRAKATEAQVNVARLAQGVAACAEGGGAAGSASGVTLPASASPVPASLGDVRGRKYMSAPSDWSAPAYSCASFSMISPQYFQYEWEQTSPSSGRAIARADLDGDGRVDQEVSATVSCAGEKCTVGPVTGP
jgi:type II secretory pathway pseudopilin PulG